MDPVKSAEPSGKSNEFIKLTDNVAKTAALPEMGDYILRDTENRQVGLALRIYSSGVRSWVVQKKLLGKPTRVVLGRFPQMSHRKAVEAALVVVGKIKSGIDPNLEKRQQQRKTEEGWSREKLTVQVVFTEYLERKSGIEGKYSQGS